MQKGEEKQHKLSYKFQQQPLSPPTTNQMCKSSPPQKKKDRKKRASQCIRRPQETELHARYSSSSTHGREKGYGAALRAKTSGHGKEGEKKDGNDAEKSKRRGTITRMAQAVATHKTYIPYFLPFFRPSGGGGDDR